MTLGQTYRTLTSAPYSLDRQYAAEMVQESRDNPYGAYAAGIRLVYAPATGYVIMPGTGDYQPPADAIAECVSVILRGAK